MSGRYVGADRRADEDGIGRGERLKGVTAARQKTCCRLTGRYAVPKMSPTEETIDYRRSATDYQHDNTTLCEQGPDSAGELNTAPLMIPDQPCAEIRADGHQTTCESFRPG